MRRKALDLNSILLTSIDEEGIQFKFDRKTGELNATLAPIINNNPYEVLLDLKRIGDAFEISGKATVTWTMPCSLCAIELDKELEFKINEIIVVNTAGAASSPLNENGSWWQDGPFVTEVDSEVVDLKNLIYEIIAIQEPHQVKKSDDCGESCDNYKASKGSIERLSSENQSFSPFAQLKELQVSKNC